MLIRVIVKHFKQNKSYVRALDFLLGLIMTLGEIRDLDFM